MSLTRKQIADSAEVGRIFKKGSFWDRAFKFVASVATALYPPIGLAMTAADKLTPDRDGGKDSGRGGSGSGSGGRGGGGGRSPFDYDGGNVAGVGKLNDRKKNYNTPKVF